MFIFLSIRATWLWRFCKLVRLLFVAALCGAIGLPSLAAPTGAGVVSGLAPYDRLTLLLPDGADVNSWQVKVWIEAAAEEGLQLNVLSDADFLAMGSTSAARISGLLLPDSAHITASNALVLAVEQYVRNGGRLMLTYDAGALTEAGVYDLSGRSRFSDLAGVNYVLYDSLRDRVVGFGPVVGPKGRLDRLEVPPGKYIPLMQPRARMSTAPTAAFIPTSRTDPGGLSYLRSYMANRTRHASKSSAAAAPVAPGVLLRYDRPVEIASAAMEQSVSAFGSDPASQSPEDDVATLAEVASTASDSQDDVSWEEIGGTSAALRLSGADRVLQVVSGYGYGALSYPTYVTTGAYAGTAYLASAEHGLVAGVRNVGAGKVLFVNLPLGYLKAIGSDGMLLQGFLTHFARDQVVMPRLSVQPKGTGGMVYNWHVDDGDDIVPDLQKLLEQRFIRKSGPFSIHFTVGPDTVTLGDGRGMNLLANPTAQDVVRRAGRVGPYAQMDWVKNELGAHGGWNHDIYGQQANESNAETYLAWVRFNVDAIEKVTDLPLREYSAPQGNNPRWATAWLERHGVVSMYTVSNTGSAATREWRDGERVTQKLWAVPITPYGKSATFEEFEETGVSDRETVQWLTDLQSFVVNHRTNRMFYSHPPGIRDHLGVVKTFLNRAKKLEQNGRFKWYTMAELADFSERRLKTTWHSRSRHGVTTFAAANPDGLRDITWLLPRSRFGRPVVKAGYAEVKSDSVNWVVTAEAAASLRFEASDR